ncbi:hypothetical protein DFR49_3508 [Hephaestia caeni]|uniref:Gluconate 2-dehydrogenase subunit 3-like protein n=1 Tax=Hephaestia caeni TaxID=645617 RepID=A0A397NW57_9SPHN|nr:hypothetical protein [Hephaestia caeni]RIA37621.1 hypothetical protein DFR49_3508 [Hephaestia caeni]
MSMLRILTAAAAAIMIFSATPASAQFFFQSRDLSGPRVVGDEPGIGQALPGATPAELRAEMVWTLRAAMNVAALQCEFEPTLLTRTNYNAMLKDHKAELAASLDTLLAYFVRTNGKNKRQGQLALDHFSTVIYSSFSTVSAQYIFCQTMSSIGRDVIYAPRGAMGDVALDRMRELHNSLVPWGEQRFPSRIFVGPPRLPRFDENCWTKKDLWNTKRCGLPYPAPGARTSLAQR